ncbi:hypothetical protein EON65_43000 [archaeon]|nr:MAG: hypothetical protein EON65_43000 [archaeon]
MSTSSVSLSPSASALSSCFSASSSSLKKSKTSQSVFSQYPGRTYFAKASIRSASSLDNSKRRGLLLAAPLGTQARAEIIAICLPIKMRETQKLLFAGKAAFAFLLVISDLHVACIVSKTMSEDVPVVDKVNLEDSAYERCRADVLKGCIPIQIELAPFDALSSTKLPPLYLLASRYSFITLVSREIIEFYKGLSIDYDVGVWFEHKGKALKR